MKRYVVLVVAGLLLVAVVVPLLGDSGEERPRGQREGGRRFGDLSPEQREQMRQRFENMSEEERAKFREQMRQRFGAGREDQLKAIAAIEGQLAALKKAIEAGSQRPTNYREMSEEERAKFRERMTASFRQRREAVTTIDEQMAVLRRGRGFGGAAQSPEQMLASMRARQRASIGRLKELQALAVKEKATQTAKGLEQLIAQQERQLERLTAPRPEGDRGPRERPARDQQRPRTRRSDQTTRDETATDSQR
ncbi:MAG: hypothetical protein JSU94_12685 [Phycisphaerales bacterium]|nr:MAG: hypothetical protein JSU94_12685 [Phycisphaerales bacterium]